MLRSDPDTQIEWSSSDTADYVQRLCGHCNTNTDIKVHRFSFRVAVRRNPNLLKQYHSEFKFCTPKTLSPLTYQQLNFLEGEDPRRADVLEEEGGAPKIVIAEYSKVRRSSELSGDSLDACPERI